MARLDRVGGVEIQRGLERDDDEDERPGMCSRKEHAGCAAERIRACEAPELTSAGYDSTLAI